MTQQATSDVVAVCPNCGGGLVNYAELAETASCGACSWSGVKSELLSVPISHTLGSREDIMRGFINDFRGVLARDLVLPLARFMKRWGFLPEKDPGEKKQAEILNRYLVAIGRAALQAMVNERTKMEIERAKETLDG